MEQRHAAPTAQRPDGQPCGSVAAGIGCDSMTTAMLALDAKSNGNIEDLDIWRDLQVNINRPLCQTIRKISFQERRSG